MIINNFIEKIKSIALPAGPGAGEIVSYDKDGRIERFPLFRKLFLAISIILVSLLSFGIGRLSVVNNREPVKIEYDTSITERPTPSVGQVANVISAIGETSVVVSKNGSKYHYLHCPGAKQISEKNKITFATPAAAEAAGYTLAANCLPRP